MSENTGFFSQILKRRIPQFFGIYLAGCWTTLEFTQWTVGRYSLSPNWEEVLVVAFLLCLPLVIVLAWHHGAPGKQTWTLFEKIFLPLYIIAVPAVLHHLYQDEDLSKTTEMVMVKDETGVMKEREVVKTAYLKPIVVYPFSNSSDDPGLDSISVMTSETLSRDLFQNQFLSINGLSSISGDIVKSELPFEKLPLSYQINLAKEKAKQYFINGAVNKVEDVFTINTSLYAAQTGKKIASFSKTSKNYFTAIDETTAAINDHFFPNGVKYTDLPIEDLNTNNWEAYKAYSQARIIDMFGAVKSDAEPFYAKADELDPTFSMNSFMFAIYNLTRNQLVRGKGLVTKALKHGNYRLTERERFSFNAVSFQLNKQLDRALTTIEQWIALYPNDWTAYFNKSRYMAAIRNIPEYIASLKKVIELDPSQHQLWDAIGDTYTGIGDYENALAAYQKYSDKNPTNPLTFKNIADLYRRQGDFDKAISNYQKALSLEPTNIGSLRNLGGTYAGNGNFKKAEEYFTSAIDNSKSAQQVFISKNNLADFYWSFGKRKAAIEIYQESTSELSKVESESRALVSRTSNAWKYHVIGQEQLAEDILTEAFAYVEKSKEDVLLINFQIGKARLLNVQGKAAEALPLFDNVSKVARSYLQGGNDLDIAYYKGQSYFELGEYEKALEAFLAINEKFPNRPGFLHKISSTYLAMTDNENAKEFGLKLLNLAPAYPDFNLTMAKIFLADNNERQAKEHLVTALKSWEHADMEFAEIIEARSLLATL